MNSNATFGRSLGLPNMMLSLYPSYTNENKYGQPIGSHSLSSSYHYNMPGAIPKQMPYTNWLYPSMKRNMHHCTGGKKMIRCGYNMHPLFPLHTQPQLQSNFMDTYQSYLPYGLRQMTNTISGSMPMEPWIFNNTSMSNDFMQMLQARKNNIIQHSVQTNDQQELELQKLNLQQLNLPQLNLQQKMQPQLQQQQLQQKQLKPNEQHQVTPPKPQEPQQTYQDITTQTVYRDTGGAGCNTVTGVSAFRFDPGSDCNYYDHFMSQASSQGQSLNRINSITSFDNGYGGRMRDSQLDLFEYNRRHNSMLMPSTTDTMETTKNSILKQELKSEIKELKRLFKKHHRKQQPPRSISATIMGMGPKESRTIIKLKKEIHDLKEKLKIIHSSNPPVISPSLQPVKLTETKSKHLLLDEICDLKRRVKDQIIKQTIKWRKRFNRNPTKSTIPPHNSDRCVFDFRKFKAQFAQNKKKLKIQRNLAAPLQNYPSELSNSIHRPNIYDSDQRMYGSWLKYGQSKDSSITSNYQQEAISKPYSVPPVKSVRQQLMLEEKNKSSTMNKSKKPKLIKRNKK